MSTTTTNYGLIKPGTDDPILVGQLNDNMDTIDTVLKDHSDKIDAAALGIKYKGEVNYYADLPNSAEIGDAYTVKYAGSSGTTPDGTEYVWGTVSGTNQWINFSKDSYTKAEVDALLALKQNALTTAQLDAVNSGINSTKVEQIGTNKNNISFLTANCGGKNKLNLIISEIKSLNTSGTWVGNTYTRNRVDFTINSDLSITVNAAEDALSLATFELKINIPTFTTATTLSGCPSGGNYDNAYALYTTDSNGNTTTRDTGAGADITNKSIAKIRILVRGGYKPTNLIFKPMICDTAIYNSEKTYQPYAPSNRELYEMILALQ